MRAIVPAALASLLLCAIGAGCSRTSLNAPCPNGYSFDEALSKCTCSTDEGCPTGMRCEAGACVCRDTTCCPDGYQYSRDSETCVCRASKCCPVDHTWLEKDARCQCGAQNCCPDGYAFNEVSLACECAGDACCPKGHLWDTTKKLCVCAADSCCPIDFRYDPPTKDCVCTKTECCPPNHVYDSTVGACVCTGDVCCPPGFRKAPDGSNRCVCINNSSCRAGQVCDSASGGCRCVSNAGCPAGDSCNALGFCQSLGSCTSNLDCPAQTFCDITSTRCIAEGPCTLDEHCDFNSVCNPATLACRSGCRRDGDCAPKGACVQGSCRFFCRDNEFCPVGQYCDTTLGTCASRPRIDCQPCGNLGQTCGSPQAARCLSFVTEGTSSTFCGTICTQDADCPSGFDCASVIFGCRGGSGCEPVPGDTITCKPFQVENESGDQFFCSDSSGFPHVYFKACAPRSGFCPASPAP